MELRHAHGGGHGRKREIVGLRNEREFPFVVELALPLGPFRNVFLEIDALHRERRIPIRRGRSRHEVKQVYIRFCFRDRYGRWHDDQGMRLFAKRLERGRFVWPSTVAREGADRTVTPAQLGYLLEGIDWRLPQLTWRPQAAG
jgi:transposase